MHHSARHQRIHPLLAGGLIGAIASLALYLHQVSWWALPLIPVAIHLTLAAVAVVTVRLATGKPITAPSEAMAGPGTLIRRAHMYDWMARIVMFGSEGLFRRQIVHAASIQPDDSILDVGCGTGTLLVAVAAAANPGGRLVGIEPSPEMRARAEAKAARAGIAIDLIDAPAQQLPFPDASFDVVFCTLVIHHLPDTSRQKALREMRRVLRPGGRLVIAEMGGSQGGGLLLSVVSILHNGMPDRDHLLSDLMRHLDVLAFERIEEQPTAARGVSLLVAHTAREARREN